MVVCVQCDDREGGDTNLFLELEVGVRWLSGEGVGLVIRRLLVRFPGHA